MQIYMTRIDPGRNMQRFYEVVIEQDLLGDWHCVRRWGRLGRRPRSMQSVFPTKTKAAKEAERVFLLKRKRGYM